MPHQSLQRIKEIKLSYCELTQTGIDILAGLIPLLPCLTSLDICNPGGDGKTTESIVKLLKALRTLQLRV